MSYLGRRGASAALTSADIPDASITAAKIMDGTIVAADLAPDSVGTSEIADSVTLVTPNIGTPSAGVVTNLSGVLPAAVTGGSGLTALGTVATGTIGSGVTFPAGHVLQAETSSYSNDVSTSSTAFVPTGHTITIDPIKSNSKIIVSYNTGSTHWNAQNGNSHGAISIYNVTGTPSQVLGSQLCDFVQTSVAGHYGYISIHGTAFEVLSTDSAQTYEIYIRALIASSFYYKNAHGGSPNYAKVHITAMEIGQ